MSKKETTDNKDVPLKPLSDYFPHYRIVKKVALEEAYRRIDLPLSERLKLFYKNMEIEFKNFKEKVRSKDYAAVIYYRSRSHSCTNGVSGRVKDCGWKCIPKPNNHLLAQNITVVGDSKGTRRENGTVCIKMTRAGKGRNAGTIYTNFKYPSQMRYFTINLPIGGRQRINNPYYHLMQNFLNTDKEMLKHEIMNNEAAIEEIQAFINEDETLSKRFQ